MLKSQSLVPFVSIVILLAAAFAECQTRSFSYVSSPQPYPGFTDGNFSLYYDVVYNITIRLGYQYTVDSLFDYLSDTGPSYDNYFIIPDEYLNNPTILYRVLDVAG
jgi:ABC-type oligopeptide transport system substrate-binding subunit